FYSSRRRHTRCYRDWSSDVCSSDLQPPCRDARLFQPLLIEADGVPFAPGLEQRVGERLARLALVVLRAPAHAERLGDEHGGPLPRAAALGRDARRGPRVQHVVAVKPGAPDAVARGPVPEALGDMVRSSRVPRATWLFWITKM